MSGGLADRVPASVPDENPDLKSRYATRPLRDTFAARPMPTLIYYDSDGVDRSFDVTQEPVLIGRATECQIQSADPRVSRRHARIFWERGELWIEDLGSANGVWVAGERVARTKVPPGEPLVIGSLVLRMVPDSHAHIPPPPGMEWQLHMMLLLERRARFAVIDERDAVGRRVGELHPELDARGGGAGVS